MTTSRPAHVLVALDIDGTLTPDGAITVPDQTVSAVAHARAAGHHVVLASGRSLVGILPVAARLALTDSYVVASNGAVTARLTAGAPGGYEIVAAHTLDARLVIDLARGIVPSVQIGVEDVGWGYGVSATFPGGTVNGRQRLCLVDELASMSAPRVILQGLGVTELLLERVRALGFTAHPASPDWIDVTPQGSKATALELVRRALGVDPIHTVAVGDGVNDLEMLAWAARGVAMGHAPAAVRAAADEVTGSLAEHGVVEVLTSLLSAPISEATR